jgi:glucosamine-6-phosphate deaminase
VASPRVVVVEDADDIGHVGADLVADAIATNPAASMTVATGASPMGLYSALAERYRSGAFETSAVTVFQLDEYLGLAPGDRRSLLGWMRRSFLQPLGVDADRVVPLTADGDPREACAAFDQSLEARGALDIAILGLGRNGHLGFNEPPSAAESPTRVVELSAVTVEDNARYWGSVSDVPTRAVTMGMRTLLRARQVVLVASGEVKRAIVHRALEGPIGPEVPASLLRTAKADVTVIVDRAAWGHR